MEFWYLNRRCERRILTSTIVKGECQIWHNSSVSLTYGSKKGDVVIGDKCRLHGVSLSSQSGGKIIIGDRVRFGEGTWIQASNFIQIGDYTVTANGVTICDNNNHPVAPYDRLIMCKSPYKYQKVFQGYSAIIKFQNKPLDV